MQAGPGIQTNTQPKWDKFKSDKKELNVILNKFVELKNFGNSGHGRMEKEKSKLALRSLCVVDITFVPGMHACVTCIFITHHA